MAETFVAFSESALRSIVNDPSLTPGHARVFPAGLNRLLGRLEFLVHRLGVGESRPTGDAPHVVVLPADQQDLLARRLDDAPFFAPKGAIAAVVALGIGAAVGNLMGVCRIGDSLRTLTGIRIAGAGMPGVGLTRQLSEVVTEGPAISWPEEGRLSRSIGALSEETFRRLRDLHIALVGCGRSGSLLATGLRRLGVRRLSLVDPDVLEPHNLGEMDSVTPADVGRRKVTALADGLARIQNECELTAVPGSVLSLPGLVALKPVDVLVCCADSGAARLATAMVAALYLKPLLDIGTGVLHGSGANGRRIGADVRLVVPARCLLCFGGVNDLDAARQELLSGTVNRVQPDWRQARRGSLRSLNSIAVGLALRLLEEFVGGRRTESAWLHLETDATGLPALESRSPSSTGCVVCPHTGTGDAGMQDLREVLSRL